MGRINGNKCKKSLIKALSVILAVLNLTQFSAMAAESNPETSYSQQEEWEYDNDGESSGLIKFVKKHPVATVFAAATAVGAPILVYKWYKKNAPEREFRERMEREFRERIMHLNSGYHVYEPRISELNGQLGSWSNSDRSLRRLQSIINGLSDLILGSHSDTVGVVVDSNEKFIDDILRKSRGLSDAVKKAQGFDIGFSFKRHLIYIHTNLSRINNMLNAEKDRLKRERLSGNRQYTEARRVRTLADCRLGREHGREYADNMIIRVELASESENDMMNDAGRKLSELCTQFGITSGIRVEDSVWGWEKSPYEYYFLPFSEGSRAMFQQITHSKQVRFAKTIELLYNNRDYGNWRGVIEAVLNSLASHGGHCPWRAQSLVDQAYYTVLKHITDNGLDDQNRSANPFSILFSELKDKILEKAVAADSAAREGQSEPLFDHNAVTIGLEYLLGISNDDEGSGIYQATELINRFTTKRELMEMSHRLLMDKYSENHASMNSELFSDVNRMGMSFAAYCNLVGKTNDDVEHMIGAIASEECTDTELKAWANGERELTIDEIKDKLVSEIMNLNEAGCSEIDSWAGIKFLAKCYNLNYFEDRN